MNKEVCLVSVVIPTHNRKEKLKRLIKSVEKNDFHHIEIIVVDDASTDGTYDEIKKMFPNVKIFKNDQKKLVSACRNVGINNSNGDFIFLIDDDNVVDEHCISELVKMMLSQSSAAVVGPIMYYYSYPKTIWCAGIKRSLISSKTTTIGSGKIDEGQFVNAIESDDFPNAFMVRSKVVKEKSISFDEKNFPWMYEEADFITKIRKKGWAVILAPKAKIWHDVPKELFFMGRYTNVKSYYLARNRVIFHKKYSTKHEFFVFSKIFLPIFTLTYIYFIAQHCLLRGRIWSSIKISKCYIEGTVAGIKASQGQL
jgi:hypothetical protein